LIGTMKVSDYIIDFLADQGVRHNFLISGGAVVHLVDSTARHPRMHVVATQHEQAAGAAADMYARITGNIGVAMTTSGPGATNLVTSVCNAYFDSVPLLVITGQVARFRLRPNPRMRQRGFQETDVVSIFHSITKYAKLVLSAEDIRYELEKAVCWAKSGRPGPVLLDIPDDLQREEIEPASLRGFDSAELSGADRGTVLPAESQVRNLHMMIQEAKRPVLIVGAGVHHAQCEEAVIHFARQYGLPLLLTWGARDLLPDSDPLSMGGVGVVGPRAGNFAAQNSDLVIAVGTRLSQMITGGKQNLFAPLARKVMVDIDEEELNKFGPDTFELDLPIHADLQSFFNQARALESTVGGDNFAGWREQIQRWKERYPICPREYDDRTDRINAYVFMRELSQIAREGEIILTDAGGNLTWTLQGLEVKRDQRVFSAWNHSPMGGSLPMAIGAAFASPNQDIVCIIGDGGLMMCLEEIGTIRRHDLPVKIFLFNNLGHGIQKQTLDVWLGSRYVVVDEESGLYFPDFRKIAEAFNVPYVPIANQQEVAGQLAKVMTMSGPVFCDVAIAPDQRIEPMLKFGAGIEDLDPKLPESEMKQIMAVSQRQGH
jgi:acetolactate synthase I/II/III large subunit